MLHGRSLIGGELRQDGSQGRIEARAPYDGTLLGTAPVSGSDEAEAALRSARSAFASWRASDRDARRVVLERVSALVADRAEPLARLMAQEVGKPIAWARAEVTRLGPTFGLAADLMDGRAREELPLGFDKRGKDYRCFVEREPRGVVFGIVPYNWPYNLAAHKLAPAIAAGCTIVLKPSRTAALSTLALAELVHDAGCPPGVVNCLLVENGVAEGLVRDDRVAFVSFTGSPDVGWHLKRLVPEKHVSLELGGDGSVLVFEDADLDLAVSRTVLGAYGYAGQVCIAVQHAHVHRSAYDATMAKLIEATEATTYGDPLDERTVCGPLISSDACDKVMDWIQEAEDGGAKVIVGGNRVGNVIQPTLIEDVPHGCRLAKEEVFGPVLTLSAFETEDEAFARVNASQYGIHCGVFTNDDERMERAYRALEVSGVIVNDFPTLRFDNMPYGGVKRSGFGREGVRCAYEEMTTPKVLLARR